MVRSNTRGMCRVLLVNCLAAQEEQKKGQFFAKYYSDYIIFAMQSRAGWKQIDDNTFEHNKTNKQIKISIDDSLVNVAKKVAKVEINYQILDSPQTEKIELLNESQKIVEHFFNK